MSDLGSWVRERGLEIQLVGPSADQCSSVVAGTASYLRSKRFEAVSEVCLGVSQDTEPGFQDTDVTIFLFPPPSRLSETECATAFVPVVEAAEAHDIENSVEEDNTIFSYETEAFGHIEDALMRADISRQPFEGAIEVSAEGMDQLQEQLFTQCSSIEK